VPCLLFALLGGSGEVDREPSCLYMIMNYEM
jgi:hypothetical protein